MKSLTVLVVLAFASQNAALHAQQISPDLQQSVRARAQRTTLPIDSHLYQFALALDQPNASLAQLAERCEVRSRADGWIKLEVVGRAGGPPIPRHVVESVGGRVHLSWRERTNLWIPADRLLDLARALPKGYFVEDSAARLEVQDHSGEEHTGSDTYLAGGASGGGISVAVIDIGFKDLTSAQLSGWVPVIQPWRKIDFTGEGFEAGDSNHGNFVLQVVSDHAPGAQLWAYRISDLTEFGLACADAAANGIDIVNISLGYFGTGWDDDTGSACAGVQQICDAGGLVFCSSGNYADTHWQGVFDDDGGTSVYHDWAKDDELLGVFINEGETLGISLAWDPSGGSDYDLILWDNPPIDAVAVSTNAGTTRESISYPNPVAGVALRFISVEKISGPDVEMELICTPSVGQKISLEYKVARGSTVSPSNTSDDNMVVVGAVQWDDYASAPGTSGISTYYSSQGPSNGGLQVPHLVAPTGTDVSGGGTFIGTSCSAPNAAGTAAALWSSAPYLSPAGLKHLLVRQAELVKDWGPAGYDTEFGWGGIWLHPWANDTVWVDRQSPAIFQLPALPYSRIAPAQAFATAGGRLLLLGGNFPEPVTLNKQLDVETVAPVANLGE